MFIFLGHGSVLFVSDSASTGFSIPHPLRIWSSLDKICPAEWTRLFIRGRCVLTFSASTRSIVSYREVAASPSSDTNAVSKPPCGLFSRKPMLAFSVLIAVNAMRAFQFSGARLQSTLVAVECAFPHTPANSTNSGIVNAVSSYDGLFLYAANRLHNSIAAFSIARDGQTGSR